jgi:hypothetical protein
MQSWLSFSPKTNMKAGAKSARKIMSRKRENKRKMCGVSLHPIIMAKGQKLAEKNGRSFSNLIEMLLRNALARAAEMEIV